MFVGHKHICVCEIFFYVYIYIYALNYVCERDKKKNQDCEEMLNKKILVINVYYLSLSM